MKKIIFYITFILLLGSGGLSLQDLQARERFKAPKGRPAKWASSFQAFGSVVMNDDIRRRHRNGIGGAFRVGYGFWSGFSLDAELQWDILLVEGDAVTEQGNKNLMSTNIGPRYSFYVLQDDVSMYVSALFGFTVDLTDTENADYSLNWSPSTGLDFHITDNLTIGPLFKYRHVISDTDIHVLNFGVAATYVFK